MKYLRGYCLDDVPLVELPEIKNIKFKHNGRRQNEYMFKAKAVAKALPWHVSNGVLPRPDPNDIESVLLGAIKRFGFQPPEVTEEDQKLYREFCNETFRKEFVPFERGTFMSFEDWLIQYDASQGRKGELTAAYLQFCEKYGRRPHSDVLRIGSFIKDEPYVQEKPLRWINARDDLAKTFFGPPFQMIGDELANSPWLIKKIPVADRAKFLMELFSGNGVGVDGTDYVSFEAHFVEWKMRVELDFYEYMLQNWDDFKLFTEFYGYLSGESGRNVCYMRGFGYLMLVATRMSGEMNTSLGNTFHNMMMIRFLAHIKGASVRGVVEGDDGNAAYYPEEAAPTEEDFARFGWKIKLTKYNNVGDASFCGNVFEPSSGVVVTDPIEVLLKLGWVGRRHIGAGHKYLMGILRCKVLSAAHQYGRNPIIWAAVTRLLELTEGVKIPKSYVDSMDQHHRLSVRRYIETLPIIARPCDADRFLVERLYGISYSEQIHLEKKLLEMDLGPFELPLYLIPEAWQMACRYLVSSTDCFRMPDFDKRVEWQREMERICEEKPDSCKAVRMFFASIRA